MNYRRVCVVSKMYFLSVLVLFLSACAASTDIENGDGTFTPAKEQPYVIGPGDNLRVFVWGNQDLSTEVPVRPDGRITTPLVEDVQASGKTPTELARTIEARLSRYIRKPVVTITVLQFVGRASEQIRVIGEVTNPQTIPYRQDMTLLDVMIAVGGLTEYASGNSATIARKVDGGTKQFTVRLEDLTNDGDISANLKMSPGDILFIPESFF